MNRIFVLGNGTSRKGLDLNSLKTAGPVYGCNALYRDFSPDILFSVDPPMIKEIVESGYHLKNTVFVRKSTDPNLNIIEKNSGWSSGPIAISYAATQGYKNIYLIGFDFSGLNGKQNNVYSSTKNYINSDTKETFYGNWVNQIISICNEHKDQSFIRVGFENQYCPSQFNDVKNFSFCSVEQFITEVNTVSWQK